MRWVLFTILYSLVAFYGFQAVKTVTKQKWLYFLYAAISIGAFFNFIYWFLQPATGHVLSGNRAYAFGVLLAVISLMLILVFFLLLEDGTRFVTKAISISRKKSSHLPSRRKFISQMALAVAALPFSSLLYGMYKGRYNYQVLTYEIEFDDLPAAFDNYQITQISDIHSGSLDNIEKINYAVDLINKQQSDAVFFTGDLVNNLADELEDWKHVFKNLKAKDGIFSVLGNHDYGDYVNWDSTKAKAENLTRLKVIQKEMGWELLLNEHRWIERAQEKIAIVGVENWGTGGFVKHGDADKASKGINPKDFKILLSHDPSYWQEKIKSDKQNYQLTLSGHTHGMQFGIEIPGWVKWSPVQYRYKNWAGIYQEMNRFINVNRGFGYLAYPGRVGIWPEITVIKLRRKKPDVA